MKLKNIGTHTHIHTNNRLILYPNGNTLDKQIYFSVVIPKHVGSKKFVFRLLNHRLVVPLF